MAWMEEFSVCFSLNLNPKQQSMYIQLSAAQVCNKTNNVTMYLLEHFSLFVEIVGLL
jgi:hypothetical protein